MHSPLLTFFLQIYSKVLAIVIKNKTIFTLEALAQITEEKFERLSKKMNISFTLGIRMA